MTTTPRQPDKASTTAPVQDHILSTLRGKIVRGEFPAGSRLPTRTQLGKQFRASVRTVQIALDRLAQEGFIHVGPRRLGTFVVDHPPHLHEYKLIFPKKPGDKSNYWAALRKQAQAIEDGSAVRISTFFGIGGHEDIETYQRLVRHVRTSRLAGLIFTTSANEFIGTPLLDEPNIPRAAIGGGGDLPGVPKVSLHYPGLHRMVVDAFAQRGRKRLAIIAPSPTGIMHVRAMKPMLDKHGIAAPDFLQLNLPLYDDAAINHVMQLVARLPKRDRPDALFIADDNLVPAAMQGLVDSPLDVPGELDVIGHASFPWPTDAAGVPITRVGWDIDQTLRLCVDYIDAQRRGETPPEVTTLEPRIEEPGE